MLRLLSAAVLLALFAAAPALLAQSPAEGADAPDFGAPTFIANEPTAKSLADIKGEVALLYQWGTR